MHQRAEGSSGRRGRPSKFGRPSRVVALTLPEDVIDRLHRVHRDLAWAIVKMLDKDLRARSRLEDNVEPDVELVSAAQGRSLIAVNRDVIRNLPGVNIIPLRGNRAFLALDIDRGMSDLELAVLDRLGDPAVGQVEREALLRLKTQLTSWRRNRALHFDTRAIIVVEHRVEKHSRREAVAAEAAKRVAARTRALGRHDTPAPEATQTRTPSTRRRGSTRGK